MIGPGKYDAVCSLVRASTRAEGAIVIVLGGYRGSGFSAELDPELLHEIPSLLRTMADEIEKDAHALPSADT